MAAVGYLKPPGSSPLADHGYRSWDLARKNVGQLFAGSDVSYNGFVFPPHLKCRATVVAERDKTNRTTKQLLIALEIEAIITPYSSGGDVPSVGEGINTTDDAMMDVRERLNQPCQQLSFTLQGFGSFYIQGLPQAQTAVAGNNIVYDVDYGPVPQVTAWEPIAGASAVRIQWLVTTRIPPCGQTGNVSGITGLLEYAYNVTWNINKNGAMNRSVNGSLELAATRAPVAGNIHASNQVNLTDAQTRWDSAVKLIKQTFPVVGGWHREENYAVSENKKILTFTLSDTEILSPSPYPKGILDLSSLHESLKSTIDDGFNLWTWNLSGDIQVFNSKQGNNDIVSNKRLALNAMYLILKDRIDRIGRTVRYKLKPGEKPSPTTPTERVSFAYPTTIEIDNALYGDSFSINFGFILSSPPQYLFQVSGMLDAVRIPGMTWDQWRDFLMQSGTRVPFLDVLPGYEGIVDLCHPLVAQTLPNTSPKPNPLAHSGLNIVTEVPSEEESWLHYENDMDYESDYFTSAVPILSPVAAERNVQSSDVPGNPRRDSIFKPVQDSGLSTGDQSSSSYLRPDLQTASEPLVVITMTGRAARIGYPINPPELLSVGKAIAVKYGKDKVVSRKLPSGFTKNGETTNIYLLSWRRSYALSGPPTENVAADRWDAKTTGHPEIYA